MLGKNFIAIPQNLPVLNFPSRSGNRISVVTNLSKKGPNTQFPYALAQISTDNSRTLIRSRVPEADITALADWKGYWIQVRTDRRCSE